jgi:hypothetical protein
MRGRIMYRKGGTVGKTRENVRLNRDPFILHYLFYETDETDEFMYLLSCVFNLSLISGLGHILRLSGGFLIIKILFEPG